jgi:putative oxidoreductase
MIHSVLHRLHNPDLGVLCMRVAIGLVFLTHGYQKLQGMDQIVAFFGMIGFAPFLAYLVAWSEVIGGILLIVGLFTRYAGVVLTIIMAVAVVHVHLPHGYWVSEGGYEYALTLLLGALAMVFMGSGKYAIAHHAPLCSTCETGVDIAIVSGKGRVE